MKWLRRILGVNRIIDNQERMLFLLMEIDYKLTKKEKEPKIPKHKG